MGNALKYRTAIDHIDDNNQNQTYAANFNEYGNIVNLIFLQIRPFDDEIPPAPVGSFDIDDFLSRVENKKKNKVYRIGNEDLDKITYDEIHRFDTYEKAWAESLHTMPNFMSGHLTKGEKVAAGVAFFSSIGLAMTFDYQ